jgi:hypothetical protein
MAFVKSAHRWDEHAFGLDRKFFREANYFH